MPGVTISQFDNLNASATLINTAGIATINDGKDITIECCKECNCKHSEIKKDIGE